MKPAADGGPGGAGRCKQTPCSQLALALCSASALMACKMTGGSPWLHSQLWSWAQTAEPTAPDKSTPWGAHLARMLPLIH